MGIIRPYKSNSFKFGDATAVINPKTNALEFEFDADGIDAVKNIADFGAVGTFTETEWDASNHVVKASYTGYDELSGQDELNSVGDDVTTEYTDTFSAVYLFDDLVGMNADGTSKSLSNQYYEGQGVYESPIYSLNKVRSIFDDVVSYTETVPVGTSQKLQISINEDGQGFGSWQDVANNGTSQLAKGMTGENTEVKFRLIMDTQTDTSVTPKLSGYTHTLKTRTAMMIETTGNINIGGVTNANYQITI